MIDYSPVLDLSRAVRVTAVRYRISAADAGLVDGVGLPIRVSVRMPDGEPAEAWTWSVADDEVVYSAHRPGVDPVVIHVLWGETP